MDDVNAPSSAAPARADQSGFVADFKRFFTRGLAVLLPTLLTIAILIWAYNFVDHYIGQHINRGLVRLLAWQGGPARWVGEEDMLQYGQKTGRLDAQGRELTREYEQWKHPEVAESVKARLTWRIFFMKYHLHLVGFLLAVAVVYFVGFFLASYIGRAAWRIIESLLRRTPLINMVYPHVKQVTDFLLSDQGFRFNRVIAVEYPRKGCWSLGLVTGEGFADLHRRTGEDLLVVFIPSSPTPVTGYVITVPRRDVVDLRMTIDEALRFSVSGGVIKPPAQVLPSNVLTASTPGDAAALPPHEQRS